MREFLYINNRVITYGWSISLSRKPYAVSQLDQCNGLAYGIRPTENTTVAPRALRRKPCVLSHFDQYIELAYGLRR